MVQRRSMGCWGPIMGMFISFIALLALAFAFRLEIHSPNFTLRFGPQWLEDVQSAAAGVLAPQAGASSQPGDANRFDLGGDSISLPIPTATLSVIFGGLGKEGSGVGLNAGVEGLLDLNAAVGGGEGVQLDLSAGDGLLGAGNDLQVGADVGGGNGVNLDVDTGLGVGANVGVDPNEGINVGVDLPGEELDIGVNIGSGGCTVWLLGQCIVP
ncbi:MAG: hypothetical protein KIT46_08355 [Anaerolineales bacterium]|nr:hypothetical protein [Anaerolineales bacterium]MCW5856042.1 hypothetical protein [Anaerolineales bacterium]